MNNRITLDDIMDASLRRALADSILSVQAGRRSGRVTIVIDDGIILFIETFIDGRFTKPGHT